MKRDWTLVLVILVAAFLLRVLVAPWGTLRLDMNSWMGWASRLATVPLGQFYNQWSDYLPGYLYVLWFVGHVQRLIGSSDWLFKLPGVLADMATGGLIYWVLRSGKGGLRWAAAGAAIYLFNPAVWGNSSLWGQVDGLSALIITASLALLAKERDFWSVFMLGFGFMVKPQIILLFPLVALVVLRRRKFGELIWSMVVSAVVVLVEFIPFWNTEGFWKFVWDRLWLSFNQYPYTSLNAFNWWGLTGGGGWWLSDKGAFIFGFSYQTFGLIIFTLLTLFVMWRLGRDKKMSVWKIFLGGAIMQFLGFFFMTRVHERHLLPVLAPLTIAAVEEQSGELFLALGLVSLTYGANLVYAYEWISNNYRQVFSPVVVAVFSLVNLAMLGMVIDYFFRRARWLEKLVEERWIWVMRRERGKDEGLGEVGFVKTKWKKILVLIVLFAAVTRFWRLGVPNTYIFDEVYHAFTAREMLQGNKAAWEWWNTPPKGFAYEWSHPPIAKELMMTTLAVVNSPMGWRIPEAFLGTVSVILVFAVAWEIFGNRTLAIGAAVLFCLDTLPLVMSRIGMNDSYFLFFTLIAVWLLLKERYLLMGVAWGLAVASKWTAVYFVGLVAFYFLTKRLWRSPKKTLAVVVGCMVIGPVLYLFSYLPFFTWGHSLAQFNELQHQMWWYHTGLKATHPYESGWWSWPLMLRPVWLAVEYQGDSIANVYAQGNPLFYWVGMVAVVTALAVVIKNRNWSVGVTLFAYGIFFLPWVLSPRIMFIYHYLPATPFLAMTTAWFLLKLWQRKRRRLAAGLLVAMVVAFLFFYPHVTSVYFPNEVDKVFYWLPSWK